MKETLAKLTFARTMILVCLLASVWLGWQIWGNHQKISQQSRELAPEGRVAELVRDIQAHSQRYTQLYKSRDSESLKGEGNPLSYITKIAADKHVRIGKVDITPSERQVTSNIVDKKYAVRPSQRDDKFTRNQIANFLFKLETDSRRVRVTEVTLEALNADGKPRVDPEEYPSDNWNWNISVTSRQRISEPGS